jgi:D-glycero-beta-D-manno-heptose 1-phosphate adenylyltransferase
MGRVVGIGELKALRANLRRDRKKVVFTNGVFDLIHRGHIEYLAKAKALGDVLVVGVNDDASVRRIKGKNRPVVNESDRAYIVANLSPVDFACLFTEDTPFEIISALVPDVLVKGADWKVADIVGKDIVEGAGGTVAAIEVVPDHSSSGLIARILEKFSPS